MWFSGQADKVEDVMADAVEVDTVVSEVAVVEEPGDIVAMVTISMVSMFLTLTAASVLKSGIILDKKDVIALLKSRTNQLAVVV